MTRFQNKLKVCEAIDDYEVAATAKRNIAHAKSECNSGINLEEAVKASKELYAKELYDKCINKYGEEDDDTIIYAGKICAAQLRKANRGDEAIELLTKLLTTSIQVFGSDHNITKGSVWALNKVQNDDEGQRRKFTKWKVIANPRSLELFGQEVYDIFGERTESE